MCKSYGTTPAIAAHTAFAPVGIEVNHLEIKLLVRANENEAVCAHTKTAVAQTLDEWLVAGRKQQLAVVNHHEVVACALVFMERKFHLCVLIVSCLAKNVLPLFPVGVVRFHFLHHFFYVFSCTEKVFVDGGDAVARVE